MIRAWVAQADKQEGRPVSFADITPWDRFAMEQTVDALSVAERDALARLRRETTQLRLERDILSRAAAWFARETAAVPSGSSTS